MFPTFISIIDIQSWWEVPSIAHFCSLFRTAFNLLDFDIEDLEEALLTDGTEESSWLQELIVRLLSGCLSNNEISTFNYQMFLRRLFRQKCQEHDRYNPFNTDIDFQLLPLRTKVDILHALCDFRLDAEDVLDQLKNLEADSLRVEPLGYDSNDSAYWYFYGTRLYREDFKTKNNKKKSIWQVICFTEDDWFQLTKKFKKSTSKVERQLHHTLSENFLPELPRLFKEKERLARKRLLENQPRRTSSRLRKLENEIEIEKEEEKKPEDKEPSFEEQEQLKKKELETKRREAYERRTKLKEQSEDSQSEVSESRYEMAGAKTRAKKSKTRQRKVSECSNDSTDVSPKSSKRHKKSNESSSKVAASQPATVGRQTNNSLAAATGQIVIQQVANPAKKKLKTSQVFRQTDEDLQTGMHKILDYVKNHEDAWPFVDPVEEEYAPNYYSIIKKPMDLQRMEDRLDAGSYKTYSKFRSDFQLIVDNCRLYNGAENEYTEMVDNLLNVFERATEKYLDQISSSDDEIAVEYLESETDNKGSSKKKKDEIEPQTTRRKPMLAAQAGKKRTRSPSEDSTSKVSDSSESADKTENQKQSKEKKRVEKKAEKHVEKKAEKKQVKKSKSSKSKSKKEKEKADNNKKSNKESKPSKSKKANKKDKNRSPERSRSPSKSPPPSHCSSPPPSWPPSSPESKVNFEVTRRKNQVDEDNKKVQGKEKETHDRYRNLFHDETDHPCEKKLKKDKSPLPSPKPKDKHNKLRETIEKLKAKSEISSKIKASEYDFEIEDNPKENKESGKKHEKDAKKAKTKDKSSKHSKKNLELEDENNTMDSAFSESKKVISKSTNKNTNTTKFTTSSIEALTLATEQTLKDINKWLDDTPKYSEFSSASNSPSYTGLDEFDNLPGKIEQDIRKKDKPVVRRDHLGREIKRKPFRDPAKFFKRREVQRTIDRLQPGKGKGNLITNVQNTPKIDDLFPLGPLIKLKDMKNSLIVKTDTNAPKLSLGSVLDSFGKHKFVDDQKKEETVEPKKEEVKEASTFNVASDKVTEEKKEVPLASEAKEEITKAAAVEDCSAGGGATPNLSAWFKAFGAPKVQPPTKKPEIKPDGKENEKCEENTKLKDDSRKVSVPEPSPNPDSPIMTHGQPIPRQRKISTGSSMSERSSFSQDMDSPRVGIDERLGAYPAPYPSPLHRSPSGASPVMVSPRPDVSPKAAAYPTFNGQIRVGFYQDTASNKSSPNKSCSPRDNPQSPYTQYSEHVYTPNTTQSAVYSYANAPYYSHPPNYSSTNPTPPYNTEANSPSYYDTSKSLTDQYQAKSAQNYTANSPASNVSSPVSHPQHSPNVENFQQEDIRIPEKPPQSAMFPVKKRAYNETEGAQLTGQFEETQELLQGEDHLNLVTSSQSEQIQRHDAVEELKQYVRQNIPDPKPLVVESSTDSINKSSNSSSPVPQQVPTCQSQVPQSDDRNVPYSTTQSQFTTSYTSSDSNFLNIPSARSITATHQELERKIEMSNYTNMGYSDPEVNFPRNMQYNRPDLSYAHTSVPATTVTQPTQQTATVNQTDVSSNDVSLRYPGSLQMGYKDLNSPATNTQQAHSGFSNQNARVATSAQQQPQDGYKSSEVSIPRPTYNSSPLDMDQALGLRGNIANLSHIVDRFSSEEQRMLSGLQTNPSSYYADKGLASSHIFNKPISTSASGLPMFSQSTNISMQSYSQNIQSTSTPIYNRQMTQIQSSSIVGASEHKTPSVAQMQAQEKKSKKRKSSKTVPSTTAEAQQISNQGFQSYAGLKNNSSIEPSAISLKTASVVPGSAFNFGPTASGLSIGSGLYGDKDAFSNFLEDFRSPSNYYMAAAAAAHHRSTPENNEKQSRVAHQSSAPQNAGYPFLGAPQARSGYPIGGPFIPPSQAQLMDPSSNIYQHYLQQAGVLNQGLLGPPGAYPPGYHPLSMRQPYDTMTRPPWL